MKKYCLYKVYKECDSSSTIENLILSYFTANNIATQTSNIEKSDIVIFITCIATNLAEKQTRKIILRAHHELKDKTIIVAGCFPKAIEDSFPDIIFIKSLTLNKLDNIFAPKVSIDAIKVYNHTNYFTEQYNSAYILKIVDGCVHKCSYCSIRLIKGAVSSQKLADVTEEFTKAFNDGHKRFVLLADDCGSYGADIGTDFAKLINTLHTISKGQAYFLINNWHPKLFLGQYQSINIQVFRNIEYACIPLQSMSAKCLLLMNRDYKIREVISKLKCLKKYNPNLILINHIIYGFPSESRKNLRDSFKLSKVYNTTRYFFFSAKIDTPASALIEKVSYYDILEKTLMIYKQNKKTNIIGEYKDIFKEISAEYGFHKIDTLIITLIPSMGLPLRALKYARNLIQRGSYVELLDINVKATLAEYLPTIMAEQAINEIIIDLDSACKHSYWEIVKSIQAHNKSIKIIVTNNLIFKFINYLQETVCVLKRIPLPIYLLNKEKEKYYRLFTKTKNKKDIHKYVMDYI